METRNDRAGIQYMGDPFALEAIQVPGSTDRTYSGTGRLSRYCQVSSQGKGARVKVSTYVKSGQNCARLCILGCEAPDELQFLYGNSTLVTVLHDQGCARNACLTTTVAGFGTGRHAPE